MQLLSWLPSLLDPFHALCMCVYVHVYACACVWTIRRSCGYTSYLWLNSFLLALYPCRLFVPDFVSQLRNFEHDSQVNAYHKLLCWQATVCKGYSLVITAHPDNYISHVSLDSLCILCEECVPDISQGSFFAATSYYNVGSTSSWSQLESFNLFLELILQNY